MSEPRLPGEDRDENEAVLTGYGKKTMRFTSVTVCRSIDREQDEKISTRLLTSQIEWMEKMSLQSD